MKNEPILDKEQPKPTHRNKKFHAFLISMYVVSFVLLAGCASEQYNLHRSKPKAADGAVFRINDNSQSCPWKFFSGNTKKRCVRK